MTEFFLNFFVVTGLFSIYIVPDKWLHHEAIIAYAIVYSSIHLLTYHYADVEFHKQHHRDPTTNFGPCLLDIFFGTQEGPEEPLAIYVPNIFFTVSLLLLLSKYDAK